MLNKIITDKIVVMMRSLGTRGHFPLSLNDSDSTFQRVRKYPVDMAFMGAMLFGSQ